jgi:hypothetical protein
MAQGEQDAEIQALEVVFGALNALDELARERVLDYTRRRLGMADSDPGTSDVDHEPVHSQVVEPAPQQGTVDIRSLRQEKDPSSAIEMAAVVAYYLSEAAPEDERKPSVSTADLEKYFKQAQFPLPSRIGNTLSNAAGAGYFDTAGRGEYKLNPVGFNLVTQSLPRSATGSSRPAVAPRRPRRKSASPKKQASSKGASNAKRSRSAKKRST